MSTPAQLLPGGLHLSGDAVLYVAAGLGVAEREARRDGIRPSVAFVELRRLVDQAAATVRAAGSGSPAVPRLPAPESSGESEAQQPIGTSLAAQILGCKERNVRDLCARGRFPAARRVAGRWLLSREEVAGMHSLRCVAGSGSVAGRLLPTDKE